MTDSDVQVVRFVDYDAATGEITRSGQCPRGSLTGEMLEVEGNVDDASAYVRDGQVVFYTHEQRAAKARHPLINAVWSNASMGWVDLRPAEVVTRMLSEQVRTRRNSLLGAAEWTQASDSPLAPAAKAAWAAYRQALRDVPQQAGFPGTVMWPVAPGNAG